MLIPFHLVVKGKAGHQSSLLDCCYGMFTKNRDEIIKLLKDAIADDEDYNEDEDEVEDRNEDEDDDREKTRRRLR